MGGIVILAALMYVIIQLVKEVGVKQVPKDMDWRQISVESARGVSPKEQERQMYSGYYNQHFDHPQDGQEGYSMKNDQPTYYICKNHSCQPPTNQL